MIDITFFLLTEKNTRESPVYIFSRSSFLGISPIMLITACTSILHIGLYKYAMLDSM
jgi:hypothetical protein